MQARLAVRHAAGIASHVLASGPMPHPPAEPLPTIKEKVTHVRERTGVMKRADLLAAPVYLSRRDKKAWVREQAARR